MQVIEPDGVTLWISSLLGGMRAKISRDNIDDRLNVRRIAVFDHIRHTIGKVNLGSKKNGDNLLKTRYIVPANNEIPALWKDLRHSKIFLLCPS